MGNAAVHVVRVTGSSGRVTIVGEQRDDVAVEGKAGVERDDGRVTVVAADTKVLVRVPAGTHVVAGTTSAGIRLEGTLGDVGAVSDSGKITIAEAATVDARTSSGRIEIGRVAGACCIRTDSGRVTVDACGDVDVATDSSRVVLGEVRGPARAHSVSGRIEATLVRPHDVRAETVSGRVTISLPAGTRFAQLEAPDTATPADVDCTVVARSVSGKVSVSTR